MRARTIFIVALFLAVPFAVRADEVTERRAALERELGVLEAQIQEQQKVLETRQRESVTLERDVDILNAKIEKAKLSIKARNLAIAGLSRDIGEK